MNKFAFMMCALVAAIGIHAADTAKDFFLNNWQNYPDACVELERAVADGRVELTGDPTSDAVYVVAQFRSGKITAGEALEKLDGVENTFLLWECLPRIYQKCDAATRETILAKFESVIAGTDATLTYVAKCSYVRSLYSAGEYDKIPVEYYEFAETHMVETILRTKIARGEMTARDAYDIAGKMLLVKSTSPESAVTLLQRLQEYAADADVPDAEFLALLKKIDRTCCTRAVGTDDRATAWGIFVGRVAELIKRY